MLVPDVSTASDSEALFGWFVSVIVADARFALSGSLTSALGATLAAGESSVKAAVEFWPALPDPFRSTTGASLTFDTAMVLVARFESTSPSLTLNSIVFDGVGSSFVVLNWIDWSAFA